MYVGVQMPGVLSACLLAYRFLVRPCQPVLTCSAEPCATPWGPLPIKVPMQTDQHLQRHLYYSVPAGLARRKTPTTAKTTATRPTVCLHPSLFDRAYDPL